MKAASQDPSGVPDRSGSDCRAWRGCETLHKSAASSFSRKRKRAISLPPMAHVVQDLVKSQPRRKRCLFRQRRQGEVIWIIVDEFIRPHLAALPSGGQA